MGCTGDAVRYASNNIRSSLSEIRGYNYSAKQNATKPGMMEYHEMFVINQHNQSKVEFFPQTIHLISGDVAETYTFDFDPPDVFVLNIYIYVYMYIHVCTYTYCIYIRTPYIVKVYVMDVVWDSFPNKSRCRSR